MATLVTLLTAVPGPAEATETTLCTGFAGCNATGRGNAGYQNVYTQSFWGAFAGHNCTNYVSYRMIQAGASKPLAGAMGNASQWGINLASRTNQTPAVGSIAWWSSTAGQGPAGHVAYVEQVTADGIVTSDDSYGGDFHWHHYNRGGSLWPTGFIHLKDAAGPVGSFDELTSPQPGAIRVRGWAFDADAMTTPVDVHVYVGGPAGSGAPGFDIGLATGSRPDVGQAYPGVGDAHGFDTTVETSRTGSVPVYVYAINAPGTGGDNQLLGSRTVTVQSGNPTGSFDGATSTIPGKVRISGWAFDPSAPTAPVGMHLYVGGPAGSASAVGYDIGLAGDLRTDVGAAFPGVGDHHGYERQVAIRQSGTFDVYLYAIDLAGTPGENVLLGSQRVTVPAAPQPMASTAAPRLSGRTAAGSTLTTDGGGWSQSGTSLSYQWFRGGTKVSGATGRSYRLRRADVGHRVWVRVTASKDGYATITARSARSRTITRR